MDTRTNYTIWMNDGSFYIVEAHTLLAAQRWANDNLGASWVRCPETKDKDYDEYLNHGHKIYRVVEYLDGQKPYNPKQHAGPRIYTINGNKIESLEDLPEGNTTVRVRVVRELNDFPESVTLAGCGCRRNDVLAMVRSMTKDYKIPAIKLVRSITHWGLIETKDFVEQYCME